VTFSVVAQKTGESEKRFKIRPSFPTLFARFTICHLTMRIASLLTKAVADAGETLTMDALQIRGTEFQMLSAISLL
jgi:hypothetical protein